MASTAPAPLAPRDRNGFQVAILCALPLEAENVLSVFDICWEDQDRQYGKAAGDQNAYTTGVIGKYNVVLVHMPSMGSNSAALAAAGLRSSFGGIRLALVVGICGVVPVHPVTDDEIVLGDVVISTAVTLYDLGRQYPDGFQRKREVEDSLSRANPEIRSFVNMLATKQNRHRFQKKLEQLVRSGQFQTNVPAATYPGVAHDRLYEASYLHQHRSGVTCNKCSFDIRACSRNCEELDCDDDKLVTRRRHILEAEQLRQSVKHAPLVHLGRFASANTVMKSGLDRDRISAADELTAFEMEGAGVWEQYPTVIIKAACDYADSHKSKKWQAYAAAMAAGGLKVFLQEWNNSELPPNGGDVVKPIWHVPFDQMPGFVGREDELDRLEQKLLEPNSPRIVSLLGLGGVGKSRLALEVTFRIKSRFPSYWILWIQASEQSTFENDVLEIGMKLGIQGIDTQKAEDIKVLVKQRLSSSDHRWILILDNADDTALWGMSNSNPVHNSLVEYLPRTTTGSILITTRSRQVASFLAETEIIDLQTLPPNEATKMFIQRLQETDSAADADALSKLVDQLACLPLALVQAASYINKTQRSIRTYIDLMSKSEQNVLKLLSQDFGDRSRYNNANNPVATTWLISFRHIQIHYPLAATLLSRMAYFHEKGIPHSLLMEDDVDFDEFDFFDAIAVLTGYSFVTRQTVIAGSSGATDETYDMHRLVRLAVRNWLKLEGTASDYIKASIRRLVQLFPGQEYYKHKGIVTMYLPHAQRVCEELDGESLPERYDLLMKLGCYFVQDGNYDEGIRAHTIIVNWRESLGLFDRQTSVAHGTLGEALHFKGDMSEAEKYLRLAFNWQKECLGWHDLDTLTSLSMLARVLDTLGKYDQAEQMHRRALEVKQVLAEDDPETLTSMHDLASTLNYQGKYGESEQMHRQVLGMRKRVLGVEHPATLSSMRKLAEALDYQGQYGEAEQIYGQAFEVLERVHGKEHPETLIIRGNIAGVLRQRGKHGEAEQILRQVVEAMDRVLGKEHHSTLNEMGNLANQLGSCRKYTEAEELHRQVIEIKNRVLGKEHPDTLTSMNNLALTLHEQGQFEDAEKIQLQVVESYSVTLGADHPVTRKRVNALRFIQGKEGQEISQTDDAAQDILEKSSSGLV